MARQTRPSRRPLVSLAAGAGVLLVLAGGYLWFLGGTAPQQATPIGGSFQLTSATGQTVTDRDYRGRTLLIYFGYTHCRDICPATLAAMSQALAVLGGRAATVQPIFITVDPGRDTPAALRGFLAAFAPRLVGLTGTPQQLRALQLAYRIQSIPQAPAPGKSDYEVDHSSVLLVIGANGRYAGAIRPDAPPAQIAADLAKLL